MGPVTSHMALHILLMNLLAPAAAFILLRYSEQMTRLLPSYLALAVFSQLGLLWIWHAPPAMNAAMQSHLVHLTMQLSLLLAAFWFWLAVFANNGGRCWRPIVALLMTSKLFCLLGVLLLFSPRPLYLSLSHLPGVGEAVVTEALADQQMAGLLMLIICPFTYLLGGVVLSGWWLADIGGRDGQAVQTVPHGGGS